MILLCYKTVRGPKLAFKHGDLAYSVVEVAQALGMAEAALDAGAFFAAGQEALPLLEDMAHHLPDLVELGVPEHTLQMAPLVPNPEKLILIGLNYRGHAAETGAEIPAQPVLFSKFNNSLAGSGESVPLPLDVYRYDYEAELAVVMGRRARHVPAERALDYVLGYCCANDLSCRDLQFLSGQWLVGKTLDRFLPLGPYLVTADQVPDPQSLGVRSYVNGELRQDSDTSDMIFSVAELISYISRYLTLQPGDVISTGTPQGVILGMKQNRVWLQPGDEVVVEVEGLGRLVSPLVAEEAPDR